VSASGTGSPAIPMTSSSSAMWMRFRTPTPLRAPSTETKWILDMEFPEGNILLCRMHVGKLNWRWKTPAHESHSICRIFPAHLIGTKYANLEEARLAHMEPLGPPGWHLSWMSEPEKKLASFVHQELVPYADIKGALEGKPLFPGLSMRRSSGAT
jgi:hypothetical protein